MPISEVYLNKFRLANRRRLQETAKGSNDDTWSRADWVACMTAELGEAMNSRKKMTIHSKDTIYACSDTSFSEHRLNYVEELSDVFTYMDIICIKLGLGINLYSEAEKEEWDLMQQVYEAARSDLEFMMEGTLLCTRIYFWVNESLSTLPRACGLIQSLKRLYCIIRILMEQTGASFEVETTNKFNIVSDRLGMDILL